MGLTATNTYTRTEEEGYYGSIKAVDPKTGDAKWVFKMSQVTDSGVLTTATNLVFAGGREGYFYALDAPRRQAALEIHARRPGRQRPDHVRRQRQAICVGRGRKWSLHFRAATVVLMSYRCRRLTPVIECGQFSEEVLMRSYTVWRVGSLVILLAALVILTDISITAQAPTTGPILRLTGTSENVSGAPDMIRIDLLRWSTDAERDQLIAAWNLTPAPAAPAAEGAARGGAGRGAGRGGAGRGGAAAVTLPPAVMPLRAMAPALLPVVPLPPLLVVDEAAAAAVAAAAAEGGRLPKQLLQHPKPLWRQLWRRPRPSDTCGLPKRQAMQCTMP